MLTIRRAQMAAFQSVADRYLIDRIIVFLKETHSGANVKLPDGELRVEDVPDEDLHRMIGHCIARAREYGLSWEISLASFVTLAFLIAPNFDDYPSLKRYLIETEVAPDQRVERLIESAAREDWEGARQLYRIESWGLKEKEFE
jgi:hypothetical protein